MRASVTHATTGGGPQAGQEQQEGEEQELLIEKQMRLNKRTSGKGFGASNAGAGGPKVNAPLVEATRSGKPTTPEQQAETAAVYFLGVLFLMVLVLGLFLAGAPLLGEEADQFAAGAVYPAYSPLVGFFLLCSSIYGYWKTKVQ